MPRPVRYSPSRSDRARPSADPAAPESPPPLPAPAAPRRRLPSAQQVQWAAMALLAVLLAGGMWWLRPAPAPHITQKAIDAAVLHTLENHTLPSAAARAAEAVAPSVVRVMGFTTTKRGKEVERSTGTGVVIVDTGVILTNLHVVRGADRVSVTFADGTEANASITGAQPENDLAVLQAHKVPDDLQAAPLRSTQHLRAGDGVVVVGFPFGIGPSASAGVVSGLQREFESPEGGQELRNLIQFDAAANPGNSGGPLVTLDGEVVGIVTAILNPTPARTFIGIGFAVPIENAAQAAGMPPF
ncbi:S1C family serine protease [Alicycliphilus denitrificans]|uniref:Peptidase S1 n=1 Tax=Alicycliphilus denitrificans TaxID=179636 RepID=A0A420KFV7_9BURK|nr:trypsin-like peptidase domain-containing protein [Alicycliphilus denitrificans]RKJ98824.1 peptidase S1 [Alicycliphilus denitrificans]